MRRVHMYATRKTRVGVLKEGKNYPVPNDVAEELLAEEGVAVDLDARPEPERAVRVAEEDASKSTKRPKGSKRAKPKKSKPKATASGADDE